MIQTLTFLLKSLAEEKPPSKRTESETIVKVWAAMPTGPFTEFRFLHSKDSVCFSSTLSLSKR